MSLSSGPRLPRLALIGASGYGTIYVQLLREALRAGTVKLSAAVIINPEQVADTVAEFKAGGTVIYSTYEEFLAREAGKIDLCLIPTGIQWHARMTVAALRAGMNVLVEKPLAGCVADSEAIRSAEAETGRWVAVGFQDIYGLEAQWFKTQILAGAIGQLREVRMIGLWPRARSYFARTHWAGRARADDASVLDSPLNNAFAHFVNLSLYFAGPSAQEAAQVEVESAELFRAHRIEMFDTAVVRARSREDVRFWFGVSHAIPRNRHPEIYLYGSAGRAEWWHEQRSVIVDAQGHRQVFPLPSTEEFRRSMFDAVIARLTDPAAKVCTTGLAIQHSRFIEAVQKAGTVRDIPESLIDWVEDPGARSHIPVVQGLESALDRALAEGSTLGSVASFAEPQLAAR